MYEIKKHNHRQLAKGCDPVSTFRELSMTSNFGCFALLRVQSKRTLINNNIDDVEAWATSIQFLPINLNA